MAWATAANELAINTMTLPESLQAAVADVLAEQGAGSRRAGTRGMAEAYRAGGSSAGIDLAAYLVARLPATFAAVSAALREAQARHPSFMPRTLIDAGSGPGTAAWAAAGFWPSLENITFLDNDRSFLGLAQRLAKGGDGALASARAVHGVIQSMPQDMSADLVIAAYALAELPLNAIPLAAERLWQAAKGMLVIVEPGTPQGFARVRTVRDALLPRGPFPSHPAPMPQPARWRARTGATSLSGCSAAARTCMPSRRKCRSRTRSSPILFSPAKALQQEAAASCLRRAT